MVLLTSFHHNHFLLHSTYNADEALTTFKHDGENPPVVLLEVEACSCAPLNQCDMKSCSDGISMIIFNHTVYVPRGLQ